MNIPSFTVFEQLVKDAVKSEGSVKDIQFVTGITDYDELFKKSIPKEVTGSYRIKLIIFI
jgi:hypothetical protein